MKRIALSLLLVLALAVPTWAATGSATWDGSTDQDWNVDTNWTPEQHPADGDTATFDGGEGADNLPTSNQPAAGTINFVIDSGYGTKYLDADFLGSAGATIGTISLTGEAINIDVDFTSATVGPGTFGIKADTTVRGDVILAGGGLAYVGAGAVLDGNVTATATSTIYWGGGDLGIQGSFDAGGQAIIHSLSAGATLTCDQTSNLDLGGDATGLAVDINGADITVTLTAALNIHDFTQTLGTFDPNEIATPITLNGEGCALTYVGGTVTNAPAEFDVIFAANGQSSWPSWTSRLHKLTVNEGATLTLAGDTKLINFVLDGTLALNAQTLSFYLAGNDWWTQTGSVGGNGTVIFYASADGCSNAGAIDVGSGELRVAATAAARTLTFSDNITCGILQAGEGSGGGTITAIVNGALTASSVVFGKAAVADCAGVLTLASSQVHRVTGAIARHATNTSEAHAFNPQGRVILGGTFTGTGITVTPTSEGMIDAGGFGRVTAVTSTGRRLVVRRAVNAAGMPLRSFNADGCTNVMFRGRKIIGEPGIN